VVEEEEEDERAAPKWEQVWFFADWEAWLQLSL
jgi:hypothetical protein